MADIEASTTNIIVAVPKIREWKFIGEFLEFRNKKNKTVLEEILNEISN